MNIIEFGDCRDTMRRWAAQGVRAQMCVTSPPYFGLRDYGHPGQLGLEATPDKYVANMVEVFRCVRDVLADDGTLWLNIGDSYAAAGSAQVQGTKQTKGSQIGAWNGEARRPPQGIKPKDLIGIPWMLAFALRADGWYLRQDIIWHKPNPMPESVRDRCTKSHEYIFLLSKSERYFFDSEAMQEPASDNPVSAARRNRADFCTIGTKAIQSTGFGQSGRGENAKHKGESRNRRSVWTVPTKPYSGAHFAVFPEELVAPCILAGSMPANGGHEPDDLILSPTGEGEREEDLSIAIGRAGLNRPRRAVEAVRPMSRAEQAAYAEQLRASPQREQMLAQVGETTFAHYLRTDTAGARAIPPAVLERWVEEGWLRRVVIDPAPAKPHRCVVLDPFMGSGTTAQVAMHLGRQYIGCELNPAYQALQAERTQQPALELT